MRTREKLNSVILLCASASMLWVINEMEATQMSIIHRLICFACKQEEFVLMNQGVIPSTPACLFTTRLPLKGDSQSDANVALVFFIIALWHLEKQQWDLIF